MAKTFQLEIITPEKVYDEGQVSYLRAPSLDGLFGVQSRHAPAIIAMCIGEIKVTKDGIESYYATSGGYADIRPENVQLLVETAENIKDIDKERAEVAMKRAQEKLKDNKADLTRGQAAMDRARNRLKITSHI
tara:strand:- start:118 stop:516 length:399 start_codon:yes stop_codon:yes gene_type:complete